MKNRITLAFSFVFLCAAALPSQQQPAFKGVISGIVRDEAGQPVQNVPVRVLRALFMLNGEKNYSPAGPAGKTNDRGEFRIFGLPPGRYFVSIGMQTGTGRRDQSQSTTVAFQLYPGVVDANQAVPVDVSDNAETHIEMKAKPAPPGYRIRGSIIDASTGKAPTDRVQIKLISKVTYGQGGSGNSPDFYDSSTGTFEIRDIPPGDYVIQAQIQIIDAAARAAGEAAWAAFPTARGRITVVDNDVEKVILTLDRPGTITGQIRTDQSTRLGPARVILQPVVYEEWSPPAATVASDGTFKVIGLLRGDEYSVQLQILNVYVKSVRYDGGEFIDKPFRYSGSDTATLDILLSSETARVSGVVTNARLEPVNGATVVLIPEQRNRADRYSLPMRTDANGRFNFASVVPGNYKLFAWESIEPNAYFDPTFLREFELQGKPIHLDANANGTADLRVIPKR